MIPIENSVAGRVADIHHLLPASGLHIVGEWFLPIRHQLMALKGTKLSDIKTVESHVHALGQCRRIIRKLGVKPIVAADTAGSARDVSERGDKSVAAIASRLAAKIYGLEILAEDVEDETHNTTRFVVLARDPNWAKQGSGPLVTTFVFRVRNLPAALYKALGGFATNGVNMTKLESYMVDGEFFATQFYADVDGHPDDTGLAFALEELKFFSREFRIVGVYPGQSLPRDVQQREWATVIDLVVPDAVQRVTLLRRAGNTTLHGPRLCSAPRTRAALRPGNAVMPPTFLAKPERIGQQAVGLLPRIVIVHRGDDHQFIGLAGRDHRLQLLHHRCGAADEQARAVAHDRGAFGVAVGIGQRFLDARQRQILAAVAAQAVEVHRGRELFRFRIGFGGDHGDRQNGVRRLAPARRLEARLVMRHRIDGVVGRKMMRERKAHADLRGEF